MRTRAMTAEHQEAAARRLAQLSSQLETERARWAEDSGRPWGGAVAAAPAGGDDWWDEHTRVPSAAGPSLRLVEPVEHVPLPGAPPAATPTAAGIPGAMPVPVPGRHASRRSPAPGERTAGLTDLVPETLRGRVGLGPAHLAVVALLVAVGAIAVAWFVVRGDPAPPVEASTAPSAASAPPLAESLVAQDSPQGAADAGATPVDTSTATEGGAGASGAATVTVDVAGKVRRPGIVVLPSGSRVVDALEGAGGARPGTDLVDINLARVLVDGEQIVVGAPGGAAPPASSTVPGGTTPAAPGAPTALVDLNLATEAELDELPEVGPVTAAAILAWREENGGFSAVTELLEVDGIGDKTLEQLTPLVTV